MKTHKDYAPIVGHDNRQGDLFVHGTSNCMQCGELIRKEDAAIHSYFDETNTPRQACFCPALIQPEDSCHNKWYMTQLRKDGL